MLIVDIKNSNWESIEDYKIEHNVPYWIRLPDNSIILATYIDDKAKGWAFCSFNDDFKMVADVRILYNISKSFIQPALKNKI